MKQEEKKLPYLHTHTGAELETAQAEFSTQALQAFTLICKTARTLYKKKALPAVPDAEAWAFIRGKGFPLACAYVDFNSFKWFDEVRAQERQAFFYACKMFYALPTTDTGTQEGGAK